MHIGFVVGKLKVRDHSKTSDLDAIILKCISTEWEDLDHVYPVQGGNKLQAFVITISKFGIPSDAGIF
jgi:hypothetical protein